ncbi:MAG: hypothetical protein ABI557_02020 [Aureliella sp.]
MARKPKHINFEKEIERQVVQLRESVGQPVPLSCRYVRGDRPILVRIEEDTAMLRYPNGVTVAKVPLRDLVDDSGYWRS